MYKGLIEGSEEYLGTSTYKPRPSVKMKALEQIYEHLLLHFLLYLRRN